MSIAIKFQSITMEMVSRNLNGIREDFHEDSISTIVQSQPWKHRKRYEMCSKLTIKTVEQRQ